MCVTCILRETTMRAAAAALFIPLLYINPIIIVSATPLYVLAYVRVQESIMCVCLLAARESGEN